MRQQVDAARGGAWNGVMLIALGARWTFALGLCLALCGCDRLVGDASQIKVTFPVAYTDRDVEVIEARLQDRSEGLFPNFEFSRAGNVLMVDARGAPPVESIKFMLSQRGVLEARGENGAVGFGPADIADCAPGFDSESNAPVLHITLSESGKARFADFTTRSQGRQVRLMLDGRVLAAPMVRGPITGGQVQVPTGLNIEQTTALVSVVKSGVLSITPISVEASLQGS